MMEHVNEGRSIGSETYRPARPPGENGPLGPGTAPAPKPKAPRKVGDVVRLVSGGPAMVVEEVVQDAEGARWLVGCRWFACRHQQQTGTFDAALLIPADPEDDRLFGYDVETDF